VYAPGTRHRYRTSGVGARLLAVVFIIWLAIGAIAAGQRGYYTGGSDTCAHAGTVAVTVLAGPLNYVGANPKVSNCHAPQPSK
jgi:membrane protein YdbS with pleckstrin-like domain